MRLSNIRQCDVEGCKVETCISKKLDVSIDDLTIAVYVDLCYDHNKQITGNELNLVNVIDVQAYLKKSREQLSNA